MFAGRWRGFSAPRIYSGHATPLGLTACPEPQVYAPSGWRATATAWGNTHTISAHHKAAWSSQPDGDKNKELTDFAGQLLLLTEPLAHQVCNW